MADMNKAYSWYDEIFLLSRRNFGFAKNTRAGLCLKVSTQARK